jgi:hypothetical protein
VIAKAVTARVIGRNWVSAIELVGLLQTFGRQGNLTKIPTASTGEGKAAKDAVASVITVAYDSANTVLCEVMDGFSIRETGFEMKTVPRPNSVYLLDHSNAEMQSHDKQQIIPNAATTRLHHAHTLTLNPASTVLECTPPTPHDTVDCTR